MIKKTISDPSGKTGHFHTVREFIFAEDGCCVAHVASYETLNAACCLINPLFVTSIRCDGVTPTEDTLAQIYGVLAGDDRYSGYEAISQDAEAGLSKPITPLPEKPAQPSPWHQWDKEAWQWVADQSATEDARRVAKERINLARNLSEANGFEAFGHQFDSDDKSVQRISLVSQAAAMAKASGQPFSIEWTLRDNSTMNLDADQLIQLPIIMAMVADAMHARARNLKAQIDTASSIEEIAAVHW